jgi:hypothetical protein
VDADADWELRIQDGSVRGLQLTSFELRTPNFEL